MQTPLADDSLSWDKSLSSSGEPERHFKMGNLRSVSSRIKGPRISSASVAFQQPLAQSYSHGSE